MICHCKVAIDYFNAGKMILEPFIEPWNLIIKNKNSRNNTEWVIGDELCKRKEGEEKSVSATNDLNINISTDFIQMAYQVKNIINNKQTECNPYKIINKTGRQISIEAEKGQLRTFLGKTNQIEENSILEQEYKDFQKDNGKRIKLLTERNIKAFVTININ